MRLLQLAVDSRGMLRDRKYRMPDPDAAALHDMLPLLCGFAMDLEIGGLAAVGIESRSFRHALSSTPPFLFASGKFLSPNRTPALVFMRLLRIPRRPR